MGPPPDPEHVISLMENPQFASSMNEALQNPQVIDQMIQSNPLLRGLGPQVREAIQDPNFRRMLTDPAMMRQLSQMTRRINPGNGGLGGLGGRAGGEAFPAPGVTDTTPTREGEGTTASDSASQPPGSPFRPYGGPGTQDTLTALLQAGGMGFPPFNVPSNTATPPQGQDHATSGATPGATNNPFAQIAQNPILQNPALMMQQLQHMQQMLNRAGGAGGGGGGGGGGGNDHGGAGNPFNPLAALFGPDGFAGGQQAAAAAAPPDNRPPEERYEEQLRQLNDMGFYEFDRNIEALRRAGGSVQGAVEYLLPH